MADAVLAAIESLRVILLKEKQRNRHRDRGGASARQSLHDPCRELREAGLRLGFSGDEGHVAGARHDIEIRGYENLPMLEKVLGHALAVAPAEVAMERAGRRQLQTFPPYDMGFEGNIAALLFIVAGQVKVDPERRRVNPFHEFVEASEDIVQHFRDLARTNFENLLLRKWVVDTVLAVAEVHLSLLTNAPEGSEEHLDDLDNRIQWVIYSVPPFFPENQAPFHYHHADDASGGLTMLGGGAKLRHRDRRHRRARRGDFARRLWLGRYPGKDRSAGARGGGAWPSRRGGGVSANDSKADGYSG
jgi:hypothetical protein